MFPSLVNCCTIDWFSEWPRDALYSVAARFLESQSLGSDQMLDAMAKMCVDLHHSVTLFSKRFYEELRRHNYVTPTSYLELITLFTTMLGEQRELLRSKVRTDTQTRKKRQQRNKITCVVLLSFLLTNVLLIRFASRVQVLRLKGGLDVLAETNVMVDSMKRDLIQKQPMLEKARESANNLLAEVTAETKDAEAVRLIVQREEKDVQEKADDAQAIRDDTQRDLDRAMPAYHAAVKALRSLNKQDITEVKSFPKPPDLVMTVMEAVCLLKGVNPTWEDAKKLLNDPRFLESLVNYKKDEIPPKVLSDTFSLLSAA
jgi:dynein heavy chain